MYKSVSVKSPCILSNSRQASYNNTITQPSYGKTCHMCVVNITTPFSISFLLFVQFFLRNKLELIREIF
jgi:hypothetical protein